MSKKISKIVGFLILIISFFFFSGSLWIKNTFGSVTVEEIIFNMKVPLEGTNTTFIYSFILEVLIVSIVLAVISYFILLKNYKNSIEIELTFRKHKFKGTVFPISKMFRIIIIIIIFVLSILYSFKKLDLGEYIKNQVSKSTLIEDEYGDPKKADITFKGEKRNLIYIYLESMESSYTSIENGGVEQEDLIKPLSELAYNNISFSNSSKLGGALSVPGTTWTVGALVSQTSGLPLKISIGENSYGEYNTFLPGAYTLGEILEENGYNQEIMFGSDASYAGRDHYFIEHGNYKIWDVNTAIEEGKMTEADKVWWGFEDKDLFEWSKEEILDLASQDKPFNFTLLTADTHFEDGYLSEYCNAKYDDQYSSVISCESDLVYEFVSWIQSQDFYDNTVIVISGDHLTMDTDFFEGLAPSYERTIYNVFINSAVQTENTKNRLFTTLDLFPSTLAAMGATFGGDRLGIGTNLFSNTKTLAEKYGIDVFRDELSKTSIFYNNEFVYD